MNCLSDAKVQIKNDITIKKSKIMKKIGIDVGSSSLGWIVTKDGKIVKKGVVTFDTGMSKGQSGGYVSPTRERREARSKRNLIRARKYRKWELLKILIENDCVPLSNSELETWSKYKKGQTCKFPDSEKFLKWLKCDFSYLDIETKYKNPYELRVNVLDNKLNKHEFGRALYHLVQRRGYKDIGETDTETEKQIARRDESGFQQALDKHKIISKALKFEFLDKNERARNQYPYRDEYEAELEKICEKQGFNISKIGKGQYHNGFVQKLWKSIIWQRPLRTQKGNIGKCTLEPKKLRCPVSHPIFEIFRAWSFINTIKYFDENGNKQPLEQKHREELFEWFLKKDKNFKFEEIKTFLNKKFEKPPKYNYPISKDKGGKEIYDTSVAGMPICKGLIDIFGDKTKQALLTLENFNTGNRDKNGGFGNEPKIIENYSVSDLWHAVFDFDEKFLEKFAIEKLGVTNVTRKRKNEEFSVSPLVELKSRFLQGYADLSLKAMCKIIPFLKQGYLYNEAVVLAKMPELIGENWEQYKNTVVDCAKQANKEYEWNKLVATIANNLIDNYKGVIGKYETTGDPDGVFAHKDYDYTLCDNDIQQVKNACVEHFKNDKNDKWETRTDKGKIIKTVTELYQEFFKDETRAYRKSPILTDISNDKLKSAGINIDSKKLYHHSNLENKYLKKCKVNFETKKVELPTAKDKFNKDINILPPAIIDSIKNPMFNKSMSILRKLINELIKNYVIDKDTEVVVEVARELNDNNKRAAIKKYQDNRKENRDKYRDFLKEFNVRENRNLNVEESIATFELWTEQTFVETTDEFGNKVKNTDHHEILREKDALKRYELWLEQKGQCMYTGKMISLTKLFSTEIQIMHTIPRSLLPDNTMANMTVGYQSYNTDLQKDKLPKQCDNYSKDIANWGTAIEPRLEKWIEKRDYYKEKYEKFAKANGNEDETAKNKRIQEKHYFKLHYDYWKDKVERFEAEEVTDKWARRQLTDTQMVSKYAREFLRTYFKKVAVQKGTVTAAFRDIFGLPEKSRDKHTHHAIDALVLTLIPINSSYREKLLKKYYKALEDKDKNALSELRKKENPIDFLASILMSEIENSTLIFNYEKDNVLKQTAKVVRKRGDKQYLKDKNGKFILKDGKKILLKAKGDAVRSELYAQTYLGKIREVERDNFEKEIKVEKLNNLEIKVKGLPVKRKNNDWIYKQGKDEFSYVVRKPIKDVLSKIDDIVDPCIRELVRKQKNNAEIKDFQGNVIRHVRIKVKAGKEVKERVNYRSKHEYKNKFYSESGSIPYAILLQKVVNGNLEKIMIPIASYEIARMYKKAGNFDIEQYIQENHADFAAWNKQLLKVGQKVFVLKEDNEFEQRKNIDFQRNRLYVITQFSEGSIWLKYHLTAQADNDIDKSVKEEKNKLLCKYESQYGLPEIIEDANIIDNNARKDDFEKRKYDFTSVDKSFRFTRLLEIIGKEKTKSIKKELDKYKKQSGTIEVEGETPLLKMSKENWNFLLEGTDFEMKLDGTIEFKEAGV
ncbi:hypothetical protein FACS189452_05090 [Bacteroidia bacterium]|nr:hypothetical protein FACS189452_05090 [Bacteroidia bacterium]GHT80903.1 hypothetical protein FACS189467_4030 [Bacteroidia bacterium]